MQADGECPASGRCRDFAASPVEKKEDLRDIIPNHIVCLLESFNANPRDQALWQEEDAVWRGNKFSICRVPPLLPHNDAFIAIAVQDLTGPTTWRV